MRELTVDELIYPSGGATAGQIAFAVAANWVVTVAGYAIGTTIEGSAGGPVGAAAGFLLGTLIGIGAILATPSTPNAPASTVTASEYNGSSWEEIGTTSTTDFNDAGFQSYDSGDPIADDIMFEEAGVGGGPS